jgi:prepilin-type processing-associated H-X9-DG protein
MSRIPYPLLCTLLGLVLGWVPFFLHGPIPEKFNVLYIDGSVAVWAFYSARLLIGFAVGVTVWPGRWYLRGPLMGALTLLPVGFVSWATPGCGPPCYALNMSSAVGIGTLVAGIAYAVTGRHHARAPESGRR